MSPAELRSMSSTEIVELLVDLRPSDEGVAWLASVITNDVAYDGVRELRRRFRSNRRADVPAPPSGRMRTARSVAIDPDRWRRFFFLRRLALVDVGPLMDPPRCRGWASVACTKRVAGLHALDALACALDLHVNQLIAEVGTDEERARLASCL